MYVILYIYIPLVAFGLFGWECYSVCSCGYCLLCLYAYQRGPLAIFPGISLLFVPILLGVGTSCPPCSSLVVVMPCLLVDTEATARYDRACRNYCTTAACSTTIQYVDGGWTTIYSVVFLL